MKNNATSVGALLSLPSSTATAVQLNRVRYAVGRGPQNPFPPSSLLSAGVRLATAICSTATSRTNRIVEINSGSKFDGISLVMMTTSALRLSC